MANLKKFTPPELSPEIVLLHILPKLPAKSLLRFKCVCKQWQSFLATPLFANIHLHHATAVNHKKVLYFYSGGGCNFQTIDCEAGSLAKPRRYPFAGCCAAPVTSFVNGLVCVSTWKAVKKEFDDMILWNPLTGDYKTLSRPIDTKCYSREAMAFELYYTCSDDDYKILSITPDRNVYIYSLRSNSWRKLEATLDYEDRIPFAGDHDSLDEKLHFLRTLEIHRRYIIIRLDLKTEKFTKIAIPSTREYAQLRLTVVRGCIELTIYQCRTVQMWQMNTNSDWMKMVSIGLWNPLPPEKRGIVTVVTVNGICNIDIENDAKGCFCPYRLDIVLPRIYIETFVSPNQFRI